MTIKTSTDARSVRDRAARLADDLGRRGAGEARLAFVLGSGLGSFADHLEDAETIPFEALAEMPRSAVPGHAGAFVLGRVNGTTVLVQKGRVHLYEGWSPFEVTRAVRAFGVLGIGRLLLTNAAGCLKPEWSVPGLMRIDDHLARQGPVGLLGDEALRGNPYDTGLGEALDRAARAEGITLQRGTYVGLLGPNYETPAEIRMFARAGASAVGMSTVAEASVAHVCGIRVAAVSCLSNLGAGLSAGPLSHTEVVEAGKEIAGSFVRLLARAVPDMPENSNDEK
ncbi:MAG: purine-nucleoside phosphorylase [Planctomycetota bacterium]|jgi:purine-nucleoside phosphorylase